VAGDKLHITQKIAAWNADAVTETLHYLTIRELATLLRTREISPVEVVDACLARIETLNRTLNAFVTVLRDEAREQAKAAEAEMLAGKWRGPLHGVPVGIKDFYDTANVRTTAAFERFKDRVPNRDAAAVDQLKRAGAIVIGKMNMHQLGMGTTGLESYFGPAQNPWDAAYIPGGSSSGSAVAVAAGLCYATLDTDAIGSCRLPAACCGVVGFKGTYGLISARGILEGEQADDVILWLSHPGITTRNVDDTAIVLDVLAEPEARPKTSAFDPPARKRLRIAVAADFKVETEVTTGFRAAVETIRTLGHELASASAPFDMPPFGDLSAIETDRKTIADRAFKNVDVLVLPTTTTAVPSIASSRGKAQALSAANTMFANYFGLPAISVPCGFDERGLPLGLQLVGRPWDEGAVLSLAYQYEAGVAWNRRHPMP
jgi:aspartyl-tRNA(Asn)/glutamyl-tRNA(Gln) amidotransferase subunit A